MDVVAFHEETSAVKSQVLYKLLELSEAMLHGDFSKRITIDFDDDVITKIVDNLNRFSDKMQLDPGGVDYSQEQTVNTFIEVISSYTNLDFKQKLPISDNGTIMDAIATGINVMGDELEQSTASKQELEIERNRLNEAQALAKIGSWELEIPSLTLTWSNEAYRIFELSGQQPESLYQACRQKIHPDDIALVDSTFANAIERGEGFDIEYKINCSDGSIKNILGIGEVVKNDEGKAIRFKGTIQDITEQKRFEETLKKAKESAEEANNAKSRFLANMSHEIRTPLNGILGLTEIVLGDELKNEHRKFLEIIRDSGKNLTQLINDILDFSKIESGNLRLENINFNFAETVKGNISPYKFMADQKGIILSCNVDESIPKEVIGDPTRISQIITNLIGNAIKFTDNGSVGISFSLLDSKDGEVTIQGVVRDTGIGIPVDKEKLIFQSFTQADNTITRKYGGTGLGLSIVKSLLQQMNGDISIKSPADLVLNRGSEFTFTLKLKLPDKPVAEPTAIVPTEKLRFNKKQHILIVDDNTVNLLVAKSMVRKFGATVTTVESGIEAIELIKANDCYDMVLMDIQMPKLNGHDATRQLRKLNFTKPIVALSANAYSEDVQNSLNSGMNDHVQKPYTEIQLFKKMKEFIE
ncbi:MAG TPA: ATP-binding protein [Cyclobacteriaceae bacterium]